MAVDDSRGECSRKCDSTTTEDEKPLKKARYVWEVKGKYHLKDRKENEMVSSSSSVPQETNNNSTNQCCIASFLEKTEAIMDEEEIGDEVVASTSSSNNNLDGVEVPVSMVSGVTRNQDYYLHKWQARQIARGFVDNTINRVLEMWTNPPFDAADFVDNCDNDGQVEDEGILMAIQSHGLRGANISPQMPSSSRRSALGESIALMRAEGVEQSTLDNFENYQSELTKEKNSSEPLSSSSNDNLACDSTSLGNDSLEMENPMDFLNAAVSVAIQKKGLSYSF